MVEEESRITGRCEEVTARITSDGEVTARVHAVKARGKVTLHAGLEGYDILVIGDQVVRVGVLGPVGGDPGRDVAAQTARVVCQGIAGGVIDHTGHVKRRRDGPQVDGQVGERTAVHAATAGARWDAVQVCGQGLGATMGHGGAISGHAVVASIKEGRIERIEGILSPIPVGLVASVATFVAERLFERPGEISVPTEEVGRAVDEQRLVDVDCDEVIVSRPGPRCETGILGRLRHEAELGIDIGSSFRLGQRRPFSADGRVEEITRALRGICGPVDCQVEQGLCREYVGLKSGSWHIY